MQSSPLHPHFKLTFALGDFGILRKLTTELSRYGLQLQFSDDTTEVSVTSVPACFLAREMNEVNLNRMTCNRKQFFLLTGCFLKRSFKHVLN